MVQLIPHERQEGGHHQGRPSQDHRWQLIAERLSGPYATPNGLLRVNLKGTLGYLQVLPCQQVHSRNFALYMISYIFLCSAVLDLAGDYEKRFKLITGQMTSDVGPKGMPN